MKFDELLAQQLSMRMRRGARDARGAGAARTARSRARCSRRCPSRSPMRSARVRARSRGSRAAAPDAAAAPGRRGQRQDRGRRAGGAAGGRARLPGGADGAHRDPRRAAFRASLALAGAAGRRASRWLAGSLKERAQARRRCARGRRAARCESRSAPTRCSRSRSSSATSALAIIDEQHRFGVPAAALAQKGAGGDAAAPADDERHADPAHAGDELLRAISMFRSSTSCRRGARRSSPSSSPKRGATKWSARVREACVGGRQAYWVCPLIEESRDARSCKTAIETYAALDRAFPRSARRAACTAGCRRPTRRRRSWPPSRPASIQLLVATTVIEVGVDVPNATLMVIEHAERFGLSQLHQLRGRVGRGAAESACILLYQQPLSETAARAPEDRSTKTPTDSRSRAQDLRLRGPGELLGARQKRRADAALRGPQARRRTARAGPGRCRPLAGGPGRAGRCAPAALAGGPRGVPQGLMRASKRRACARRGAAP